MKKLILALIALTSAHISFAESLRPTDDSKNMVIRLGVKANGEADYMNAIILVGNSSISEAESACIQKQKTELKKAKLQDKDFQRFSLDTKVHLFVERNAPKLAKDLNFFGVQNGKVELGDSHDDDTTIVSPRLTADGRCLVMDRKTIERHHTESITEGQDVHLPDVPL